MVEDMWLKGAEGGWDKDGLDPCCVQPSLSPPPDESGASSCRTPCPLLLHLHRPPAAYLACPGPEAEGQVLSTQKVLQKYRKARLRMFTTFCILYCTAFFDKLNTEWHCIPCYFQPWPDQLYWISFQTQQWWLFHLVCCLGKVCSVDFVPMWSLLLDLL